MRSDIIETYDCYDDIPDDLDHVIEFLPEIPPEPHTQQQHKEINAWLGLFNRLMEKAYATSSEIG